MPNHQRYDVARSQGTMPYICMEAREAGHTMHSCNELFIFTNAR